jgi:hypothetical protein
VRWQWRKWPWRKWPWRKKTVRGFGWTGAAGGAAALLALVTVGEWRDGDPVRVVAALAAATAIASGLAARAFRVEAERAFGPPGSPERRRRRLSRAQLTRSFGAGALAGGAAGVLVHLVSQVDDSGPSGDRMAVLVVYFGLLYGAVFAWNVWAAVDEDEAAPDLDGVPARSVPRPVAAPPRDRQADRRRAIVVCALLAVVGVLVAVEGVMDGDGVRTGLGIGLAAGTGGLLLWAASQEE